MIWYKSRDNECLVNLSKAVAFEIDSIDVDYKTIQASIPIVSKVERYVVETFQGDNAQAKAEQFIRWLSTIIADSKIADFVYDDSCFLQFACDEIEEEAEK